MKQGDDGQTSRRSVLKSAAGGLATVLLGSATPFPKPAIAQTRTIEFTLSWLPTGQYAYVSLARQLFWKDRGLEVEVKRGYGSLATIQAIASGQFNIGSAATSTNLLSIFKGLDLRFLGTHAYDSTMGILVPANGPIKTPKDLEGRKIGVVLAGGDTPFLPAYLEAAEVDPAKVTTVSLDSQLIEQAVMSGQVDAMIAFGMSSIPNFMVRDFPVKLFPFSAVDLDFYWVNSLTRPDFLKEEPQLVADIVQALLEGQKFALLNPEETVERHLKEHPEIAASDNGRLFTELGVGMINANLVAAEEPRKHSLGYSDFEKMEKQAKLVKKYVAAAGDKAPPPVNTYCTNEYIGKVTLTAEEWSAAKERSRKYAEILGLEL